MPRYYGYNPVGTVKSAIESFESTTQVRAPGGILLGKVYVDICDEEWGLAIAYNRVHAPGIHGPEPVYEVRYTHSPGGPGETKRIDTRTDGPGTITTGPFASIDDFLAWAVKEENGYIAGTKT